LAKKSFDTEKPPNIVIYLLSEDYLPKTCMEIYLANANCYFLAEVSTHKTSSAHKVQTT